MQRAGLLILSSILLAFPACLAGQAPDASYLAYGIPEPIIPKDGKPSLITGRLATVHALGSFPCPEQSICVDSVWDDTFADLQTQLGPAIDPTAHIRSVHDSGLRGDPIVAYVVKRAEDGQLWAIDIQVVRKKRACFGSEWAKIWPELVSHPRTKRSGDEVCFRLR